MFWNAFFDECKRQKTSPNAVCKAIGLSNAVATGWKNGTLPKADILCKLADYLNVSVDYLLDRELHESVVLHNPELSRIMEKVMKLSDNQISKLEGYLDSLLDS